MRRIFGTTAVLLSAVLALSACGGGDPLSATPAPAESGAATDGGTAIIGSANFPENILLASIYSQALQAKGVQVEEKFNLGTREVIYPQLESGGLTVVPEYNGSVLAYLDQSATATSSEEVNAAAKEKLPASLELLDSAAAEDKDSLTVTKATATEHGLTTVEDLAKVAKDFVIGGPPEFKNRREQQFKDVYGLEFKEWQPTAETTADALKAGTIQVGNVFTTDPKIILNDLVSLEDPKNVFSSQNITPLVNKSGVNDTIRTTLNAVSAKLDTATLIDMMRRITVDKDDPPAVAKDWLTQNGLL